MENPENQNLNPDPSQGGAAQGQPGASQPAPAPQPSVYTDLKTKKGWKSDDDVAHSYMESEKELSRRQTKLDNAKKQLEAQGVTLDEQGNIVSLGAGGMHPGQGQPPYQPPQGGYPNQGGGGYPPSQYPPQQGQEIYDPYTGQVLTNPLDVQLAGLPLSQRMGVVVNAMMEQREKHQGAAFANEQEIINTPEAKGFEDDLRKVMMSVPLADRANKEKWKDALLRVKGARYEQDKKNWGQQSVDMHINKANAQNLPGAGAGGAGAGGVQLSPQQESAYQMYARNHPGMFKDRADFLQSAISNTGGR